MAKLAAFGSVVFAKDIEGLARFYEALVPMQRVHAEPGHIVLEDGIPQGIADKVVIGHQPAKEWTSRGFRVCDGVDPEGNVVQFREAAASSAPASAS